MSRYYVNLSRVRVSFTLEWELTTEGCFNVIIIML